MSLNARITNFAVDTSLDCIFASDDRGTLHALDFQLRTLQSSAASIHSVHLLGLAQDADHVYTRDVAGNMVRWRKQGLIPVDFMVSEHFSSADAKAPTLAAPSTSNAIAPIGDHLLLVNACGSITVLNRRTMAFDKAFTLECSAFAEFIGESPEGATLIADTAGNIYTCDIATGQSTLRHRGGGYNTHSIVFDRKHGRYLITSDMTGGIYGLTTDFKPCFEAQISNDDVERIVLSPDGEQIYVACFDHYVHILANTVFPEEVGCIGPFKMQVTQMAEVSHDKLGIMLESGELYIVDRNTGEILAETGGTNAFWEITVVGQRVLCASESGSIEQFDIASTGPTISFNRTTSCADLSRGRVRRTAQAPCGLLVCVTADGAVMALDGEKRIAWEFQVLGICRDVAIDREGRVGVACTELGEVFIFEVRSGKITGRHKNTKPVYCVQYDSLGRVVFGERGLSSVSRGGEKTRLVFLDPVTLETVGEIAHTGNHKRLRNLPDGRLLLTGNGGIGASVIDVQAMRVDANFNEWISNTAEDAVVHEDRVYVCTYGYQVITYDLNSRQTLDVQYIAEGYPKSLQIYVNGDGIPFLLVGGRNCLMAFRLDRQSPELVSTRFLFDTIKAEQVRFDALAASHTSPNVRMRGPQGIYRNTVSTQPLVVELAEA